MKNKLILLTVTIAIVVYMLTISAFAESITSPNSTTSYFINAYNVNLRSGPGINYSSGGQVNKNDRLDLVYAPNGTFVYYGSGYTWYHVRMISGQCSGSQGYVVSTYVSHQEVPSLD